MTEDIGKKPKFPESCKIQVQLGEVAKKQEFEKYKTKKTKEDRERPRYLVRINSDSKTATLTDTQNKEYIETAKKIVEWKKAKNAAKRKITETKIENLKKRHEEKIKKLKETIEKKCEIAYKKGLKGGKPSESLQERIAKKQTKIQADQEKLKDLKAKASGEKSTKKEEKKGEKKETSATE